MKVFLVLLGLLPHLQSVCVLNKCSSWWSNNKENVTGICAVLFEENCCATGQTSFSVTPGQEGKLCGTVSGFNPFSSCEGPRLEDDVESFIVMPGCKLEVWDDREGAKNALAEESKGFNQGNLRDAKDRYNQDKLVLEARDSPNWIEELKNDFDELNKDIGSYR